MPAGERAITQGGERRHLTVMFCDLVGSTAMSELYDPEDAGELILAYQEMGRAEVERVGGHVAQYLGDGLLAYFGYPVAHEDDAERAVRAGLAIVAGLDGLIGRFGATAKVRLQARVGVHTGATIVGAMGSADRSDTSVFGSTPNIAARLEAAAEAGMVLISDDTRRLLGEGAQVHDLGRIELKGVRDPVHVWQVTDVEGDAPRLRREATVPMVDRRTEWAALIGAVDRARDGDGNVVLVSGEPGVGKSRLMRALQAEVGGPDTVWIELQCAELSASTPLAPVRDLLERLVGLRDAPEPERRQRMTSLLEPLGPRLVAQAPYLHELLGIGDPNVLATEGRELRRRRGLEALADWTVALAADKPAVVVAEDVHWCDPSSFELLGLVAARTAGTRVLLVVTQRPEGPVNVDERVTSIVMPRLQPADADELVRLLVGDAPLDRVQLAEVADRGDGVPLFLEELVRAAREGSGQDSHEPLPASLQAVLAARLDRLGADREIAQAAAVLGRSFTVALLKTVTGMTDEHLAGALERLTAAGIVESGALQANREFRFHHSLIQQAAYSSLLKRRRQELHTKVVDALRVHFADLPASRPELMAHHLARAGEHAAAAVWYERAGRRAAERAAFDEAVAHYRSGLAVLDDSVAEPERSQQELSLHILHANALMGSTGLGGADLLPVWQRAIELAERLGDHEELSSALNGAAVYYADHGDGELTVQTCERILDIADQTGSRVAALRGNGTYGMHRFFAGEGAGALEHFDEAIRLSRRGDFELVTYGVGHDENVFFHTFSSWVLWWLGQPDAALARALAGSRRASSLPSSLSQAMAGHSVAMAHHLRGEGVAATAAAAANQRLAAEVGLPFWQGLSELVLGAELARSEDETGLAKMDEGLGLLMSIGSSGGSSFGLAMIAEGQLHLGRYELVGPTVDAALDVSAALHQPFYDPELLRLKALALAHGPDRMQAEAASVLEQSWQLALDLGARAWALRTAITGMHLLGREAGVSNLQVAIAAMGDGASTIEQREAHGLLAGLGAEPSPVVLPLRTEEAT